MIESVLLKNFGPLSAIDWPRLGKINLVLGGNGSGKTTFLKALYSAQRTIEEFKRGDDQSPVGEILADKLYWTFQAERIGEIVTKGGDGPLQFEMRADGRLFTFGFGKDTSKQVSNVTFTTEPRKSNSIFFPAKEVLSLHQVILRSREQDKSFGFDDTYLDLARALRLAPTKGRNYEAFAQSRKSLESIIGGRIEFDETSGRWYFKKGNQRFSIGMTAEGVKKISILDTLLGNRYLDDHSIVFFDEPEAALHPEAVSQLLDIVVALSERGLQFFLASHSYFVLKKLALVCQEKDMSIPILHENGGFWATADLRDGLPDNGIIRESIRLYKKEVELALP